MTDPLARLVIDESTYTREELAAVLDPYLRITSNGSLIFEPGFALLDARSKVCCVLLGLRAANLLGLRDRGGAGPTEVVELAAMAPGTVRPKLSQLAGMRVIRKEGSDYVVPLGALRSAIQLIERGGSRDQ